MKNIFFIFTAFIFALFLNSCFKISGPSEEDKLPSIVPNKPGVFGCLVNGESYVPSTRLFTDLSSGIPVMVVNSSEPFSHHFSIETNDRTGENFDENHFKSIDLEFSLNNDLSINKYTISFQDHYFNSRSCSNLHYTLTDTLKNFDDEHFLKIIELDTVSHFISGEFAFKLTDERMECLDVITISKGRFGVKY